MKTSLRSLVGALCAGLVLALCLPVAERHAQSADPVEVRSEAAFREARMKMVQDELIREGIKNQSVLASMRAVPRHRFVKRETQAQAYFDQAMAIGHKQTISPPFIVAYMTEMLDPQPTDRVLEIGTGSGYQAAVLSGIVKEVYTIEIVEPLGIAAKKLLKDLGFKNVSCKVGDGYLGWPEKAPFDKIIVTCSPENVPQPLIDQLRDEDVAKGIPGGKMIIPVGERYNQVFYLFEKKGGKLEKHKLLPALFVPMTGTSEEKRAIRPDPLNPKVRNGGFEESPADDPQHPDDWYYQRQLSVQTEGAPEGTHYVTFTNSDIGRGAQMLQGMAIDGAKISALRVSVRIRAQDLKVGSRPFEKPALIVHFYDDVRKPVGEEYLGPWLGASNGRNSPET